MAYEPKEWVCGETITADALNHLENGLADCCGGGGTGNLLLHEVTETIEGQEVTRLDHTWQEICDAMQNGSYIYQYEDLGEEGNNYYVIDVLSELGKFVDAEPHRYIVYFEKSGEYSCNSSTDYPIKA